MSTYSCTCTYGAMHSCVCFYARIGICVCFSLSIYYREGETYVNTLYTLTQIHTYRSSDSYACISIRIRISGGTTCLTLLV